MLLSICKIWLSEVPDFQSIHLAARAEEDTASFPKVPARVPQRILLDSAEAMSTSLTHSRHEWATVLLMARPESRALLNA